MSEKEVIAISLAIWSIGLHSFSFAPDADALIQRFSDPAQHSRVFPDSKTIQLKAIEYHEPVSEPWNAHRASNSLKSEPPKISSGDHLGASLDARFKKTSPWSWDRWELFGFDPPTDVITVQCTMPDSFSQGQEHGVPGVGPSSSKSDSWYGQPSQADEADLDLSTVLDFSGMPNKSYEFGSSDVQQWESDVLLNWYTTTYEDLEPLAIPKSGYSWDKARANGKDKAVVAQDDQVSDLADVDLTLQQLQQKPSAPDDQQYQKEVPQPLLSLSNLDDGFMGGSLTNFRYHPEEDIANAMLMSPDLESQDAMNDLLLPESIPDALWSPNDLVKEPAFTPRKLDKLVQSAFSAAQPASMHNMAYACRSCSAMCTSANELRRHYGSVHSRHNHCLAAGCHMSFKLHKDLVRHTKTHTQERPWYCPHVDCEFFESGFTRSDILRRHQKRKHQDAFGDISVD